MLPACCDACPVEGRLAGGDHVAPDLQLPLGEIHWCFLTLLCEADCRRRCARGSFRLILIRRSETRASGSGSRSAPKTRRSEVDGTTGDRPISPAQRDRMRRVRRQRWLVVSPAPVCAVRPYRLLRHLAIAACQRACGRDWSSAHPELRARRGVVLELPGERDIRGWSCAGAAAASSG